MKKNWLKGKHVILTGVSSGIGKQLCILLIKKYGAYVIGVARNEEKVQRLIEELGEDKDKFSYRLFDVSQKENWQAFADEIQTQRIPAYGLINNAGVFPTFKKAEETPIDTIEKVLKTNYLSIVYAITYLSPILQGEGKDKPMIVNVTSSAALCTVAGTSAYTASKCALKGYTESLQLEDREKYIAVFYPGTTDTDLFRSDENTRDSALQKLAMSPQKMAKKIGKKIYRKRKRAVIGWDAKCMNFINRLFPKRGIILISKVMKASKSKVFEEVYKN